MDWGDCHSGEERRVLIRIDVPAMAGLGLPQVAEYELNFVNLPKLEAQKITVPEAAECSLGVDGVPPGELNERGDAGNRFQVLTDDWVLSGAASSCSAAESRRALSPTPAVGRLA